MPFNNVPCQTKSQMRFSLEIVQFMHPVDTYFIVSWFHNGLTNNILMEPKNTQHNRSVVFWKDCERWDFRKYILFYKKSYCATEVKPVSIFEKDTSILSSSSRMTTNMFIPYSTFIVHCTTVVDGVWWTQTEFLRWYHFLSA